METPKDTLRQPKLPLTLNCASCGRKAITQKKRFRFRKNLVLVVMWTATKSLLYHRTRLVCWLNRSSFDSLH